MEKTVYIYTHIYAHHDVRVTIFTAALLTVVRPADLAGSSGGRMGEHLAVWSVRGCTASTHSARATPTNVPGSGKERGFRLRELPEQAKSQLCHLAIQIQVVKLSIKVRRRLL